MMRSTIGTLPTGNSGFGTLSGSGRRRVPNPPTRTTASTDAYPFVVVVTLATVVVVGLISTLVLSVLALPALYWLMARSTDRPAPTT